MFLFLEQDGWFKVEIIGMMIPKIDHNYRVKILKNFNSII